MRAPASIRSIRGTRCAVIAACALVACVSPAPTAIDASVADVGRADGGTVDAASDDSSLADAASPSPRDRVLAFLRSQVGTHTLSGIHNRHSDMPSEYTAMIHDTTGHYPALWSGDFLFDDPNIADRPQMIAQAQLEWSHGAVVNIMFHACPPGIAEPCDFNTDINSHLTDAQWMDLITDGGMLNTAWKARLDEIIPFLQQLENAGVAPLFRPIHEMNQGNFWWGGRPGPMGTRRLFQITHDYLVRDHGLTNMIWVWDVQDLSWDFAAYDPGTDYSDVVALDMYGDGYTQAKYDAIIAVANGRPMAIGECQVLPTAAELDAQPQWVFFMSWSELTFNYNTGDQIRALYSAPRVLTLDRMPGW
jgi:mannan endo-1,4-beta-mannosidase